MGLLDLIAEDKVVIIYRPRLNVVTGDANSTILLCQIIYWRKRMGRAFFKPMAVDGPTEAEKSFSNELGFSKKEIERASKNLSGRGLIIAWYQRLEHRTWWDIPENLEEKIRSCYAPDELSSCNHTKSPKVTSGNHQRSLGEVPKGHLENTEITAEITTSSSPTPPVPTKEEDVKNVKKEKSTTVIALPTPFSCADKVSQMRLTKASAKKDIDPVQLCHAVVWEYAQAGQPMREPIGAAMAKLAGGEAAETIAAWRQAQARKKEKKAADAVRRQTEQAEEKQALEKRGWHKQQARAAYEGLQQSAAQGGRA